MSAPRSRRARLPPTSPRPRSQRPQAIAPDRRRCPACRTPGSATRASAGYSGTTTSASTNRPPGAITARTRVNSSRFSAPSRWWTAIALATRSNGPPAARPGSVARPARRRSRGGTPRAKPSIGSLSSTPISDASGWRASRSRAVSPVPVPSSRIRRPPSPPASTSSCWRRSYAGTSRRISWRTSPGGSGTGRRAVAQSLVRHRSRTHDQPGPVLVVVAQVDDCRRRPRQLAAVDHQIGGRADRVGDVLQPARIGATGAGWRSIAAPAIARRPAAAAPERGSRACPGLRRTPAETGAPGSAAAASPRPASAARMRRARPLARARAAPRTPPPGRRTSPPKAFRVGGRLSAYSRSTAPRLPGSHASP